MSTRLIIVGIVGGEFRKNLPMVLFVEHDQMIGALAPDRPNQTFNVAVRRCLSTIPYWSRRVRAPLPSAAVRVVTADLAWNGPNFPRAFAPTRLTSRRSCKMTGMPSFGLIKVPDQEIWTIGAFLKKLPTVSDADFKAWSARP